MGANNTLPTNTTITFGTASTNGTLDLNGFSQQVGNLTIATGATAANQIVGNNSATADGVLMFNGTPSPFAGTIQDGLTGTGTHKTAVAVTGGTVMMSGNDLYTGGTTISNGATVSFVSGGLGTSGAITINGNSTLQWASGNTDDISGRLVVSNGANAHLDTGSNNVTFASGFGSNSTGAITKYGAGTLTLTGANAYTGGTTINNGTVSFATGGLGTSGTITLNGNSTLQWASGNTDDISGRLAINSGVTATLDTGSNTVTFASTSYNSGSLIKAGSGTLILTGNLILWGSYATINAGTIQVGTGGTSGWLGANYVTDNGSLVFDCSDNIEVDSAISGTGNVTQLGTGMLTLGNGLGYGDNTYTGGTTIAAGTVSFRNNAFGASGSITVTGNATVQWWHGIYSGNTQDISSRLVIANGVTATLDTNGNDVTLATGFGGGGSGAITKVGNGTLTLGGVNTYTGTTTVNAGTLNITSANAIAGGLTINDGTTVSFVSGGLGTSGAVVFNGNSTLRWASGNTDDISNRLVLGNGANAKLDLGSNNVTFAFGFGGNSTGTVTKYGAGTLMLGGANTYTGGTTINSGNVIFASGGLGTSGTVAINSNATLQWASGNTDDISGRLAINSGVTATLDIGSNTVTFASNSSNYGSLIKAGSGTLILTGNLILWGNYVMINAGTIRVGTGGTSGWLGAEYVADNGSLVFDRSDDINASYAITGPGSVTQLGTGMLSLGDGATLGYGDNTYTGGTTINAGTVSFRSNGFGPSGTIAITGNSTLQWWSNALDISDRLVIDDGVNVTFNTNGNNVTLATALGNDSSASIIKVGEGTLTLAAANAYMGNTTVDQGTLTLEDVFTVAPNSTFAVNNEANVQFEGGLGLSSGGTLVLNNSSTVYFVGSQSVTGTGQIELNTSPTSSTTIQIVGTDDQNPATLTITSGVTVHGSGAIEGYYASDNLINQGTIQAEQATLTIDVPYVNQGTLAALGTGVLDRGGVQLDGHEPAVSGTELLLTWSGIDDGAESYVVQLSADAGANFTTIATVTADDRTYLQGNLLRDTSYSLRVVATYADGTKEIYNGGPVSTLDLPDTSGWYRITGIDNMYNYYSSFSTLAPGYSESNPWVFAGSPQGAIIRSLPGLVTDGSVPAVDSSGDVQIIQYPQHPVPAVVGLPINGPLAVAAGSGQLQSMAQAQTSLKALWTYSTGYLGDISTALRFVIHSIGQMGALNAGRSSDPVQYSDGAVDYSATDLTSNGLGEDFGQSRSWTPFAQWSVGQRNGTGWIDDSLPSLQQTFGDSGISIIRSATDIETFELLGGQYVPTSYNSDTLVHDTEHGEYVWADSQGDQIHFYDFSASTPFGRQGQLKSMTNADGVLTYVAAWASDGAIQEVRRQDANGNDVESWLYSYLASPDPNAGQLASAIATDQWERWLDAGSAGRL